MGAREQMVDAAEWLAAERGMAAMSLREVQAAAGQRNKSAAQYHFGSRTGLIEAIAASRMGPINERRARLLEQLDEDEDEPDLRALVAVVAEPLAEATAQPGSCWSRFLAQCWSDPDASRAVRRSFEAGPYRDARRRIARRLDHLPVALRERRLDHAVGLIVMSLAASEHALAHGGADAVPADAAVADLVDVVTAVLAAPPSDATLTRLDEPAERIA